MSTLTGIILASLFGGVLSITVGHVGLKPDLQGCSAGDAEPSTQKWLADIFLLARQRLALLGVKRVYGGGLCTFTDAQKFYSYRRDQATGRMASLIWLA
ncbi:MAG: hypothetical protein AUK53_02440 [Betaproteobacteria bacterium CG2_30_59_46]|nr:MAG: hypothetical protein AUK53_02440 [Betaproteobacteria bacterium CG2_30_59_46]